MSFSSYKRDTNILCWLVTHADFSFLPNGPIEDAVE